MIKLSDIKSNPKNPRLIKDDKFKKLVNSIKEFPKMMDLRPIIIDNNSMILGGNMRLKALLELKYSEVPNEWIKKAKDLTEEETKRFIIADNVGFGDWDYDTLADQWDNNKLNDWGMDVPGFDLYGNFNEEKPYNFMNKVTVEFEDVETATAFFEKCTLEKLKAKLS